MSRTVTTRRRNRPLLLQNETDGRARNKSSQSVTSEVIFAELLLQIEIFGDPEESTRQIHHKGACPHCGGFDVCPDKTCQNKPVPFWQVLGLPGAGGFDVDVLAGYGMRKGYAVGMEHEAARTRRAVQVIANQGMALACQVHADLVLAAGEQLDIDI